MTPMKATGPARNPMTAQGHHHRLAVVVVLAVAAVLFAACSSAATVAPTVAPTAAPSAAPSAAAVATPEPGTFQMGIEPWLGYGPWRVAEANGLFAKNGVDAKITNFTTDDEINAALASGQLDGANIATHTALRLAAAGLPIKIVLLLDQSNEADAILAGPSITSIADLKGKKVAYEEGTTSDILLRYALSENGMTIDDIQKVPMAAADAGAAVIAGRVDAAVTYEPYLTVALQQDPKFKLLYTAKEKPGIVGDVFVVRDQVLKEKPGQIQALLAAWDDAVAAYNADKPASQAIIEKSVEAEPGSLKTAFDGVLLYSLAEAKQLLNGDYLQTLADVKKIAQDAGIMKGDVDEKAMVVTDFVNAAP